MISRECTIRVRYCEVDQMGYLHHSRYAQYYEVSRTEMIRELYGSYRDIEESGLMLPLVDLNCRFISPAFYDDLLTITTSINEMPSLRLKFNFEIKNQHGKLINTGSTTLVFVDMHTRRPVRAPQSFTDKMEEYFKKLS